MIKQSDFSIGEYRAADYEFDPAVTLATDGEPDGELLALEREIARFERAIAYLDGVSTCAWNDAIKTACVDETVALASERNEMVKKMRGLRAATKAGRRAKVRVAVFFDAGAIFKAAREENGKAAGYIVDLLAEFAGVSLADLVAYSVAPL